MRSACYLGAILAFVIGASVASAAPMVFYNPITGGISMSNDTAAPLAVFYVLSSGNNLTTDANQFASLGGAVFDSGDLPAGFTYLNFPKTNGWSGVFVGNVVKPGTNAGDLSAYFYRTFAPGAVPERVLFPEPEPTTAILVAMAAAPFISLCRRSRR